MSLFQRIKSSYLLWLFLVGLLAIPALLPLFSQGMFVSDDGGWMIVRSSAFHEAFRDGQVPTRFLGRLNQEYGYPVAHFLYGDRFVHDAEIAEHSQTRVERTECRGALH